VLNTAETEAQRMKDEYVSAEHLLLALAEVKDGAVAEIFRAAGLTKDKLLEASRRARRPAGDESHAGSTYEALDKYGRDLTRWPSRASSTRSSDRDEEIPARDQIFSRRTKNNPVLIGAPGVGKTGHRRGPGPSASCARTCPRGSRTSASCRSTMGALGAGAKYRGEFESG